MQHVAGARALAVVDAQRKCDRQSGDAALLQILLKCRHRLLLVVALRAVKDQRHAVGDLLAGGHFHVAVQPDLARFQLDRFGRCRQASQEQASQQARYGDSRLEKASRHAILFRLPDNLSLE